MMTASKVSVIIPAYNAAGTIEECLASVAASHYSPLEIIVVDDGSTDTTFQIAADYAQRDSRVRVLRQENTGVCKARNRAIGQSTGDYILPVDADDMIMPGLIATAAAMLDADKRVKVVQPRAEFFGARSGEWRLPPFSLPVLARRNIIPATAMYRRTDWERVGGYCEGIIAREDWDFWISVLKDGGNVVRTPEVMYRYRIAAQSKRVRDRKLFKHVLRTLNSRHADFFERELGGPLRRHRSWSRAYNRASRAIGRYASLTACQKVSKKVLHKAKAIVKPAWMPSKVKRMLKKSH